MQKTTNRKQLMLQDVLQEFVGAALAAIRRHGTLVRG